MSETLWLRVRLWATSPMTYPYLLLASKAAPQPTCKIAEGTGAPSVACFVLKQVRVGPGSFEPNFIVKNLVDQNPIRFDMAVPAAPPIPTKLMIAIPPRKWLFREEKVDDSFQFYEVLASLLRPLDVPLELIRLAEPHLSQEA